MAWSFWASYLLKLGVVTVLLAAMYTAARALRRMRPFACQGRRSMRVIETAVLSQHATIHLLNVGTRCFLIGTAGASIATLAELAPADLQPPKTIR